MATDPRVMAEMLASGGGTGMPPGGAPPPVGGPPGGPPQGAGAAPQMPTSPEEAIQVLQQLGITPEVAPVVKAALDLVTGGGAPAPGGPPPGAGGPPPPMPA